MKKIVLSFLLCFLCLGVCLGVTNTKDKKEVVNAAGVTLEMNEGAQFRSYWSTPNCGISFTGTISDSSTKVYLFIAPYDYVTTVRGGATGDLDYINAFESAGKAYTTVEPVKITQDGLHIYVRE